MKKVKGFFFYCAFFLLCFFFIVRVRVMFKPGQKYPDRTYQNRNNQTRFDFENTVIYSFLFIYLHCKDIL